MNSKLDQFWNQMIMYANSVQSVNKDIIIHGERKKDFEDIFHAKYSEVMDIYMSKDVVNLDRHKVAAVLIYSIIKVRMMEYRNKTQICKENYQLAISLALSYIVYEGNLYRKERGQEPLERIKFPEVYNGDKDYKNLLLCTLEMLDINDDINVLQLANMMLLLERFND